MCALLGGVCQRGGLAGYSLDELRRARRCGAAGMPSGEAAFSLCTPGPGGAGPGRRFPAPATLPALGAHFLFSPLPESGWSHFPDLQTEPENFQPYLRARVIVRRGRVGVEPHFTGEKVEIGKEPADLAS